MSIVFPLCGRSPTTDIHNPWYYRDSLGRWYAPGFSDQGTSDSRPEVTYAFLEGADVKFMVKGAVGRVSHNGYNENSCYHEKVRGYWILKSDSYSYHAVPKFHMYSNFSADSVHYPGYDIWDWEVSDQKGKGYRIQHCDESSRYGNYNWAYAWEYRVEGRYMFWRQARLKSRSGAPRTFEDVFNHPDSKWLVDDFIYSSIRRTFPYSSSASTLDGIHTPDVAAMRRKHFIPVGMYSSLASEALASLKFNSNNIANILAGVELLKTVASPSSAFSKATRQLRSMDRTARGVKEVLSDKWLSYRYVYETTKSDIEEGIRLITQKDQSGTLLLRAGSQVGDNYASIKIATREPDVTQYMALQKFGLEPSLYNGWDMIPFSFVVDWFVSIGDTFEQINNAQWAINYEPLSVVKSWTWKEYYEGPLGPCEFSHYERIVTRDLPTFVPYSSGISTSGTTWFKRMLDTISLFG